MTIEKKRGYVPTEVQMGLWFPKVDPGVEPFGSRVLVQIKQVGKVTRGGILLSEDTQGAEQDNTVVALVRSIGPLAYRKRDTLDAWPEGIWCPPGTIVRVPRFGNHERFVLPDGGSGSVEFRLFDDFQMLGLVTSDPDQFRAYL